jgi:hypothetical protein
MIAPASEADEAAPSMPLSPTPDLSPNRRLLATAAIVTLVVTATLVWRVHNITTSLGDTDDAMRLVMVRELLHGRGWYDQEIGRLQPPVGVYMHWSRLVDGGVATLMAALRLVFDRRMAETVTRFVWPLLWIFPVVLSGLAVARALGGRSAAFVCAVLIALDVAMFVQFRPGRIDHHNIQIALTIATAACALVRGERRVRFAALAGACAALGLAVGVEALAFQALIGASFALRLMADRRAAGPARAYGLTLGIGSLALFLVQTPPWRWGVPLCDAQGVNLALALGAAGLGLAAVGRLADRLPDRTRIAAVAAVGLLAAGLYLGTDPACLRGPFGSVDPRVRGFWFDHIQELKAWPALYRAHPAEAIHSMTIGALGAVAAGWLLARGRRDPLRGEWMLAACGLLAIVAEARAYRMEDYGLWFGTPSLAILLGDVAARWLKDRMVPAVILAIALSPAMVSAGVVLAAGRPKPPRAPADHCYDTWAYAPLARLPQGIVLSEPDLGSFVLANTRDSAMSAPYHRMTWGILATHDALAAPAAEAEERARALHATYVLDCPAHKLLAPGTGLGADLRAGRAPTWLEPLSEPGQPLRIYRVKGAA